ncbi:uncharacterized protein B0T15DRAFT_245228 [Chaetomium strumarium]|uniref:RING-type E3 ubiquitin transferase n=1 Tax=Chaetomium strumarium TaxID=1170767 RepID=A0AAJ0GR27_9PEZI|nr:hypothetical protein B0T15DRAFT_245228 [Chaetomium strumarium]
MLAIQAILLSGAVEASPTFGDFGLWTSPNPRRLQNLHATPPTSSCSDWTNLLWSRPQIPHLTCSLSGILAYALPDDQKLKEQGTAATARDVRPSLANVVPQPPSPRSPITTAGSDSRPGSRSLQEVRLAIWLSDHLAVTSTVAGAGVMTALLGRPFLASLLLLFLPTFPSVRAGDVRVSSLHDLPMSQLPSFMQLHLAPPETEAFPLTYSVYPLTERAGLSNDTDKSVRTESFCQRDCRVVELWWLTALQHFRIRGDLVAVELPANSDRLNSLDTIAFLGCDSENATKLVNQLVANRTRAILLYSIDANCCAVDGDEDLSYASLYTMANAQEAADTLNNTIRAGGVLRASISGNPDIAGIPTDSPDGKRHTSAVAMSILYSITGLVTLLFLVIIVMGAMKARRHPELYGPRVGDAGRPPQSRARGLARAVLETLPIVKFGDPRPAKADPSLELESQPSVTVPDPAMGTRLSAISEEPRTPQVRRNDPETITGAVSPPDSALVTSQEGATAGPDKGETNRQGRPSEERAVCSICAEDFTVGEDVRVLPCDHRFHPPCIDPWLVEISGSCPLCRLDLNLRPHNREVDDHSNDPFLRSPPLAAAENWSTHGDSSSNTDHHNGDTAGSNSQQRRRSSRFLDLHRLRHASVEEVIEILRRHRSQQQQQQRESAPHAVDGNGEAEDQRGRRARLADRLKERFHIRTRVQGPAGAEITLPPPPPTTTTLDQGPRPGDS